MIDQEKAHYINKAMDEAQIEALSTIEWFYKNEIKIHKIEELRITRIDYRATSFLEAFQLTLTDKEGKKQYKLPI